MLKEEFSSNAASCGEFNPKRLNNCMALSRVDVPLRSTKPNRSESALGAAVMDVAILAAAAKTGVVGNAAVKGYLSLKIYQRPSFA